MENPCVEQEAEGNYVVDAGSISSQGNMQKTPPGLIASEEGTKAPTFSLVYTELHLSPRWDIEVIPQHVGCCGLSCLLFTTVEQFQGYQFRMPGIIVILINERWIFVEWGPK